MAGYRFGGRWWSVGILAFYGGLQGVSWQAVHSPIVHSECGSSSRGREGGKARGKGPRGPEGALLGPQYVSSSEAIAILIYCLYT